MCQISKVMCGIEKHKRFKIHHSQLGPSKFQLQSRLMSCTDVLLYTVLLAPQPLWRHFWSMELVNWELGGSRMSTFYGVFLFVFLSQSTVLYSFYVYILCLWGMSPGPHHVMYQKKSFHSTFLLCGGCGVTSIWQLAYLPKAQRSASQENLSLQTRAKPFDNIFCHISTCHLHQSDNCVIFLWGGKQTCTFFNAYFYP